MDFEFGQMIENGWASEDNPQRRGLFVRKGIAKGRMNRGPYVVMTDGRGSFWRVSAGRDHKLSAALGQCGHTAKEDR